MKASSKQLIGLLIGFFCLSNLYSQTSLHGKLFLDKETPAYGAFVSLVAVGDSLTPLDYTIVEEDGSWQILTDIQGEVFLRMAYVGYQEYFNKINLSQKDSLYFEEILQADVEVVKEVEVTAKAIDIVQKGDTLRYNVKNFLSGDEQTLGDVLQKLDGFEIDANNQISYNGKKIDKILIEGKDILNDQHQLAAEGISAEDLLAVDLIEQFKDRKEQFSGEHSDKLALNIDLDNQNKTIWTGNIELGLGYQNKWQTAQNLIGVGDKYGITLFGKGNNTGEAVISQSDFMSIQSPRVLLRHLNQSGGNLESLMPSSLTLPLNLQQNRDGLLALNGEFELSKDLEIKTSLLTTRLDRTSASDFIRNYVGENQVFNGNYTNQSTLPLFNFQSFIEYQWKERLFIELELPFSTQREEITKNWEGFFNQSPSKVLQENEIYVWNFSPQLYFDVKFNKNTHLIGTLSHTYRHRDHNNNLRGIDTLFDFSKVAIHQKTLLTEQNSSINLDFYHSYKKIRFGTNATISRGQQEFEVTTSPLFTSFYNGQNKLRHSFIETAPFILFKNQHWFIKGELNAGHHNFLLDEEYSSRILINPSFTVRYNFSKLHFLLFTMKNKNNTLGINQVSDLLEIEDGQTLRSGGLSPSELPFLQTYAFNYVNFNLSTRTLFNATISISQQQNVISNQITNYDNFVKILSIIQPSQQSITGQLLFNKPILKNKIKLKSKLNYQYLESTLLQNGQSNLWAYQNLIGNITLQSNLKSIINYNVGIALSSQQQTTFQQEVIERNFNTIRPNINLTFHKKQLTLKSKASYIHFVNNTVTAPIINWNLEFIYQSASSPLTFSIVANNVLNFNPREQVQLLFNPIFVEVQTFDTFGGFVLAKVNYKIKK